MSKLRKAKKDSSTEAQIMARFLNGEVNEAERKEARITSRCEKWNIVLSGWEYLSPQKKKTC